MKKYLRYVLVRMFGHISVTECSTVWGLATAFKGFTFNKVPFQEWLSWSSYNARARPKTVSF